MKKLIPLIAATLLPTWAVHAEEGHAHQDQAEGPRTVTGEVLDLTCYLGHGASGEEHANCAKTCIESGLPVGLKGQDGKTYLVVGDHKPVNKQLAAYAGQTVTLRGKVTMQDGIHLLSNAELVK